MVNGKVPEIQLTIPTATADDAPTHEQSVIFAQENDVLLTQMSSTLSTVLSAESSILEISQLQSSLIAHLQSQSETIDRLYDDAVGTVNDVERANKELKKAKERGGEARVFLLVFLIGGSLTLLFLDWYS
jgi:syntaxin 18